MEALSGGGWFDVAVRDAHYSVRKAFFSLSVCFSGTAALIDDVRVIAQQKEIIIFHSYRKSKED